MSMPPRVLLAGSRGCIARAFRAYMCREHPEVGITDLLPFPFSLQNLATALQTGTFTHFVNAASRGDDKGSLLDPYAYFDTNVAGVYRQLEMVRRYSPTTRYLNLGTIYESASDASPYVASKRMAREVVTSYRVNHDLYAVTATLGFTEYDGRPETCLSRRITKGVARIAAAIKGGQPFEPLVLRDLDQRYSWTWAEDVADGMWRVLNQGHYRGVPATAEMGVHSLNFAELLAPEDYLVSSAETHTVRSFVERAFAAAGFEGCFWDREEPIVERGHLETYDWVNTKANTGHALVRTDPTPFPSETIPSDATQSVADLGWSPKVSFDQLVDRMVRIDLAAVGL